MNSAPHTHSSISSFSSDTFGEQRKRRSFSTQVPEKCGLRVLLRPWLMQQVQIQCYTGLEWLDKNKTLLRIPWKHGSRNGWSVKDCKLFENWAKQSGRPTVSVAFFKYIHWGQIDFILHNTALHNILLFLFYVSCKCNIKFSEE